LDSSNSQNGACFVAYPTPLHHRVGGSLAAFISGGSDNDTVKHRARPLRSWCLPRANDAADEVVSRYWQSPTARGCAQAFATRPRHHRVGVGLDAFISGASADGAINSKVAACSPEFQGESCERALVQFLLRSLPPPTPLQSFPPPCQSLVPALHLPPVHGRIQPCAIAGYIHEDIAPALSTGCLHRFSLNRWEHSLAPSLATCMEALRHRWPSALGPRANAGPFPPLQCTLAPAVTPACPLEPWRPLQVLLRHSGHCAP